MRPRDLLFLAILSLPVPAALAQDNAAVEEGRLLLKEHNCNGNCHQSHAADNEALSLYTREERKAKDFAELDRYVRLCVANVGSMVFPEDIPKMSTALNVDFYKYK